MILFFNEGYVNLVKSFLCNIEALDATFASEHVILLAASSAAADSVKKFMPKTAKDNTFTLSGCPVREAVEFGTVGHLTLELERLYAQQRLIRDGVNHMIIEADAVWLSTKLPR